MSVGTGLFVLLSGVTSVWAGGHTWRINEVFSSADGTVQFIELIETCGGSGETSMGSVDTNTSLPVDIANLAPGTSASKRILLGTSNLQSFGGPAPDYIIPANFFSLTGDTIQYIPYHNCSVASGTVPTNGTSSLNRATGCLTSTCPLNVAVNSPTNFAGDSSPIVLCTDNDLDGYGNPGNAACPNGAATDCNDANPDINPGETEVCTDAIDNDCDALTDCADPGCTDYQPEICDDTIDNDCDELADCDDPGCVGFQPEDCDDLVDNDCDDLVDCDDPECLLDLGNVHCIPTTSAWGLLCLMLLLTTAATLSVKHRAGLGVSRW